MPPRFPLCCVHAHLEAAPVVTAICFLSSSLSIRRRLISLSSTWAAGGRDTMVGPRERGSSPRGQSPTLRWSSLALWADATSASSCRIRPSRASNACCAAASLCARSRSASCRCCWLDSASTRARS